MSFQLFPAMKIIGFGDGEQAIFGELQIKSESELARFQRGLLRWEE